MEIALLFANSTLARPLQALRQWCWPKRAVRAEVQRPNLHWNRGLPHPSTSALQRTVYSNRPLAAAQPLRALGTAGSAPPVSLPAVARLAKGGRAVRTLHHSIASGGGTGPLVLAGRMADVCAELERLAAREAQH